VELRDLQRRVAAAHSAHQLAVRLVEEEAAALDRARAKEAAVLTAQKTVQEAAAAVQQAAHEQIARVVSSCLETVFEADAYEFRVVFEQKRGRTEARLAFVRDGREYDPAAEAGGGVVDVAAFGLRLAALLLTRPARRPLLVLDEPFRMISRDYAPRVRAMVEQVAERLDVQIVQVTHSPALAAGKVIEIT